MTDSTDSNVGGTDPRVVSQPLPPEVPAPRSEPSLPPESTGLDAPGIPPAAAEPDPEWWRAPATGVPEWAVDADSAPPPGAGVPGVPEQGHWPGADSDAGAVHGMEGIVAAHEIGAQIGEAISSHLPGAQEQSRKLDLRWLLLKYNVPGVLLSLLVTWGGRSSVDRVAASVSEDGIFAPVGVVLCFVLVGLVLMVLPIGSWLGAALGHMVSAVAVGLVRLSKRAWTTPYIGYLMRLAVAVVVWSFVIAVVRVIWRAAVHFLTGA
ncbi:hypothetical protein [Streptomyces sp. NPDC058394]|uniref:hypothetical protein n=1 Tax=Streptomyces sp. NPDC058394 TaxID=3346477 RepID=UPI003659AE83